MTHRIRAALTILLALLALAPAAAEAQRRGRSQDAQQAPWLPIRGGLHIGYDQSSNGEVIGAHLRVPLMRNGLIEFAPNADVTFLTGLKEYQYGADVVVVPARRSGGLYAGVGLAWRNTIFGPDPTAARSTERGYSVVAGVKSGGSGLLGTQVEARWVFLDQLPFDPRLITLGISFALNGGSRSSSAPF